MVLREEGFFSAINRTHLYYQTWTPAKVEGHLVITHGHGEHSECYARTVDQLRDLPYKVWAWDLRGHGRSQGVRGAVSDFYVYTQDYEIFLRRTIGIDKLKEPLVLMAHSMGGLIQLKTLLGYPEFEKHPQILSAPLLGLSMEVPTWKKTLSRLTYEIMPEFTLSNEVDFHNLSSDPEVLESYRRDPYRHEKISAGAFEPTAEYARDVIAHAPEMKAPILCFGSDKDPVVSTAKFKEFYERLPSGKKTLKLFRNRKHEVLNDLGREEAVEVIKSFLKQQIA